MIIHHVAPYLFIFVLMLDFKIFSLSKIKRRLMKISFFVISSDDVGLRFFNDIFIIIIRYYTFSFYIIVKLSKLVT